jgi:hypothetical protein
VVLKNRSLCSGGDREAGRDDSSSEIYLPVGFVTVELWRSHRSTGAQSHKNTHKEPRCILVRDTRLLPERAILNPGAAGRLGRGVWN